MYLKLRKPTEMQRATVQEQVRMIVPPEAGGHGVRRVQVLVPDGAAVLVGLDQAPDAVGQNRSYKLTQMTSGYPVYIMLMPAQFIVAASARGNAYVGVIIEYLEEGA